jgi:CRISPR/Cas system-associated exonuclease Cas4 (RecB family)
MQLITLADLARPEEQLSPLISQAQKLGELWLEFIKQDDEAYDYRVHDGGESTRSAGIHASEMSKCLLKLVYSIAGVERRPNAQATDANMKLRFRTGTAIHAMLQSDFKRMANWYSMENFQYGHGLTFESELKVKSHLQEVAKAWDLSSSCDGAFTFWRHGQFPDGQYGWMDYLRVGVEIKTSSAPSYEGRKKPEPEHMEQTCLYQATLDLPLMWVLYYNKSNSNFTTPYAPWLFKFDRHLWESELEMRFAKAHHLAETRQMPERTEGKHCSWCPFSYLCQPKVLNKPAFTSTPIISSGMLVRRT